VWDSVFDLLSALLWDPVAKRPRLAALLWIIAVVVTFALVVLVLIGR